MAGPRRFRLLWAGLLVLVLVAAACGGGSTGSGSAPSGSATATLKVIKTATDVEPKDATAFAAGTTGQSVGLGDTVRTDAAGFAELDYPDGSLTRLDVGTTFTVQTLVSSAGTRQVKAKLDVGRTWNRVQKVTTSGGFEIDTSNATATVQGTVFVVGCTTDGTCTFLLVEGILKIVTTSGQTVTLTAGNKVVVSADGTLGQVVPLSPQDLSDPWILTNQTMDGGAPPSPTPSGSPTSPAPVGLARLDGHYGKPGTTGHLFTPDCPTGACGGTFDNGRFDIIGNGYKAVREDQTVAEGLVCNFVLTYLLTVTASQSGPAGMVATKVTGVENSTVSGSGASHCVGPENFHFAWVKIG